MYYCITSDFVVVSTNIYSIQKISGKKLRLSSLILEITGSEFIQYGKSSILQDVYTLLPGEMLSFENGHIKSKYDTSIKTDDKLGYKKMAFDFVDLLNEEFQNFYNESSDLIVAMSGGIDSRLNLAALIKNDYKPKLKNFGCADCIDSKIPVKIANKFNLSIDIYDPTKALFPSKNLIQQVVKETDSLYINGWFSLFEPFVNNSSFDTILLGDMCDIFRAKGINSLKTREFRKAYYTRKFFNRKEIGLNQISEKSKNQFIAEKQNYLIRKSNDALKSMKYYIDKNEMEEEINADLMELVNHLNRYNPQFMESYEELFGIFSHGRRSMGKQLNLLKIFFTPEIPVLNMRIVRNVLNFSPNARYSVELTNEMFKHHSWRPLGNFPTSQNPFISYNSNYYAMLFGWFLRSSLDQILLKTYVNSNGKFKRQRVVKTYDQQLGYSCEESKDNFYSYFDGNSIDASSIKKIFDDRSNKKSWPLSGQDLMPFVQANYYFSNISR